MGSSLAGLRRVRAVTKVVGRRTALRYLAVGAGVSVLAACGNGSGQAGSSGPVGHAVSTFVRGKWRVHAMRDDGGELPSYVVHITAGKWMVRPYVEDASLRGAAWEWSGRWALRDSKLTLHGPWRPGEPEVQRKWAALDVPDEITEAETVRLPWHIFSHDPPDIDKLKVTYAEGTVHLIHTDGGGGSTEFTCTRL